MIIIHYPNVNYLCGVPIPVFVIYELLIRIHAFNPSIGTYVSHTFNTNGAVVFTTTGTIRIRKALLNRQFKDPGLISEAELVLLVSSK